MCGTCSHTHSALPGGPISCGDAGTFVSDPVHNLFPVNRNVLRCADTDANLVALYADNRHGDLRADHYGFANAAGKYERLYGPCGLSRFTSTSSRTGRTWRPFHTAAYYRANRLNALQYLFGIIPKEKSSVCLAVVRAG
jgi:hypothetical protein